MTIGVDLGLTVINAGIVESGVIIQKITEVFQAGKSEDEMVMSLRFVIKKLMNTNIKGIGISIPTAVDSVEGIVHNSIYKDVVWSPIHLRALLEREFRIPVSINNDANCLAYAERYYGVGTSFRNIVTLKMSAGLGAGIIINDEMYNGWNTSAGEIGHISYLDKTYEDYCAAPFFKKYNTTGYIALLKAENNESEALQIWKEFGTHIGNLLKIVLFAYDPQAIILGGEMSRGYSYFSDSMMEQLTAFPFLETLKKIKILVSKKEDIGILGAAALIP